MKKPIIMNTLYPVRIFLLLACVLGLLTANAQLPWLHVQGNRILDSAGNNVTLRGVSILAPEHNNECTTCNTKPISEMMSWQADAGRGWNSRIVRLQVTNAKLTDPAQSFASIIDPYVQQAIARGLYIIVDLHFVSNYGPGGVPQNFVLNFWKYVAPRYANVPNVLFEVFNEPINPDVWTTWKAYIQPVIDTIRAVAPKNIILVGGPQWSTRVNSAAANPMTGGNLVYVYHIYPNQGAATSTNLNAKFGTAAQTIPVMLTEFGWNTDANYSDGVTKGATSTWGTPFRTYMDAHPEIGWTGYIFDNYWKPQYFDWNWNLMTGDNQGAFMQKWLRDKRGQDQPHPASITAYAVSPTTVNLSWPGDSLSTSYSIQRATTAGGPYTVIDSGVTATTYSDTTLTASTTYYYKVASYAEVNATTESAGTPPDVPMYFTFSASNGKVTLGWWQTSVGASSYTIKRATSPNGPFATIATGITVTGYTDSNLVNGKTYYYTLHSMGAKESAPTQIINDMPSDVIVAVDNTAATTVGTWSASTSAPGWFGSNYMHDGNTGATGGKSAKFTPNLPVSGLYDVTMRWVCGLNRASNTPVDVNYSGGSSTFIINQQRDNGIWKPLGSFNFDAGTTGNVTIRNDSTNGYVMADGVRWVLNPGDVSATSAFPDSLQALALSSSQISLSWIDRSINESGFKIDRALDTAFSSGLVTDSVGANVTSFVDTALSASTTYYYRVRACNAKAAGAYSSVASATTGSVAGGGLKTHLLKLYPNPAKTSVTVEGLPTSSRSLSVYDVLGVKRLQLVPNQQNIYTIDITSLQPGLYIVLSTGGRIMTGVFIKK